MTGDRPRDEDLIDTGAPHRAPRLSPPKRIVVVAALAIAAAVVSLPSVHHDNGPRQHAISESSSSPSTVVLTLARLQVDGSAGCGTLDDGVLSVAFAVLNTGGHDAVIAEVRPVPPLAGLRPLDGLVDHPPSGTGCPDEVLRLGDTLAADSGGWIALSFAATVSCLAPLPIEVEITYMSDDVTATVQLNPFPDLGSLPAAAFGCPTAVATS